jgi:hypothetical protein
MINSEFNYVPEWKPNNVKELIAGQFNELAKNITAQSAAAAEARKAAQAARNKQLSKLYGVSSGGFEGWSTEHIDEYESQFMQALNNVQNAPDQASADRLLAESVLHLERLHGAGNQHADLYTGQNSAHDQYVQWGLGAIPWRVDGQTPITSDEDLLAREERWGNTITNQRKVQVGGYLTTVGDYITPQGQTIRDQTMSKLDEAGIPYTEQTDAQGFTYLVPGDASMKPIPIAGPLMQHPDIGNRAYFTPDSTPNLTTYVDFANTQSFRNAVGVDFANTQSFRNAVGQIEANYDSDAGPLRGKLDAANAQIRRAAVTMFNSSPVFMSSAMKYFEEVYGVPFQESMFVPDEQTQQSLADVEGYKMPKDLFIDGDKNKGAGGVMDVVGLKRNIPTSGGGSRTQPKFVWSNARKDDRYDKPSSLPSEDYKLNQLYGSENRST